MGSRPDSGDFCFADVPKCPKISPKKKSHVSKLVSKCPKMSQTGKGTVLAVVFVILFVDINVMKCPTQVPTSPEMVPKLIKSQLGNEIVCFETQV